MTNLVRQKLGDMTDEDVKAEGYPSLQSYKDVILGMHHGMKWDDGALVWVHHFKVIETA